MSAVPKPKVVKDPAYLSDAKKRRQDIAANDGAHVQSVIAGMYGTPKSIVDRVVRATTVGNK